jgi:hypothetical protein
VLNWVTASSDAKWFGQRLAAQAAFRRIELIRYGKTIKDLSEIKGNQK